MKNAPESENILSKIDRIKNQLPKQQHAICVYILSNPMAASVQTIAELSENTHVGSATVIRTIKSLGFDKFNQFKAALRQATLTKADMSYSAYWNMSLAQGSRKTDIHDLMDQGKEVITNLSRNQLFTAQIELAASKIVSAANIYTLGMRASMPASLILGNGLINFGLSVVQLSGQPDYIFDYLAKMTSEDILIINASPPLVKQITQVAVACYKRHIPIILITGKRETSLEQYANVVINTETHLHPLSLSLTVFAINLLINEVGDQLGNPNEYMENIERFLKETDISIWDK